MAIPQALGPEARLWLSLSLAVTATTLVALPGLLLGQLDLGWVGISIGVLALAAAIRTRSPFRVLARNPFEIWSATHRRAAALRALPQQPLLQHLRSTLVEFRRVPTPRRSRVAKLRFRAEYAAWYFRRMPGSSPDAVATARLGAFVNRRFRRLIGVTAAVVVAGVVVLGPQTAPSENPWPSGLSLYYWHLGQATVDSHGLPASIGEWGTPRPFPTEYLVTTVHGAVSTIIAGDGDLGMQEHYRLAVLILAALAGYALASRWLPRWWALLAAILGVSSVYLSSKLSAYRPETFAFVLVLWAGWLFDEGVVRQSWRWVGLAGAVAATSFLAHGSAWLIVGPLWFAILVGRFAAVPRLSRANASRSRARRLLRLVRAPVPVWPLAIAAVTFLLTVAIITGGSGTVDRFTSILTGQKSEKTVTGAATTTSDPTWDLFYFITYQATTGTAPDPPDVCGRLFVSRIIREPWEGIHVLSPVGQALLALAVLSVAVVSSSSRFRRVVIGAGVFAVSLYLVTEALCLVYHSYVPARAGPSRVLPYYFLAIAVFVALCGWVMASKGGDLLARLIRLRSNRPVLQGRAFTGFLRVGLAAIVTGGLLVSFTPQRGAEAEEGSGRLSEVSGEAYLWLRDHVEPDAVVLTNAYTAGSLVSVSGRTGWLDGRAPYLESSEWLTQAIGSLQFARNYFADPGTYRNELPSAIDYVLVGDLGVDLGGKRFVANFDALRREPNLVLVQSFHQQQILLFAVVPDGATGAQSGEPQAGGASPTEDSHCRTLSQEFGIECGMPSRNPRLDQR